MTLRAPEAIFQSFIPLVECLNFDLSKPFSDSFINSIISSYTSSNINTRARAFELFKGLTFKSNEQAGLTTVFDKIVKAINGKISNWEHRILFYQSLELISKKSSESIDHPKCLKATLALIPKETHDVAFSSLMLVIANFYSKSLNDQEVIKASVPTFEKGLKSDKPAFRKAYAKCIGNVVWQHKDSLPPNFLEPFVPGLASIIEKIQKSPLANQSMMLEGFIAIVCLELARSSGAYEAILTKHKYPEILFNKPAKGQTSAPLPFILNDKLYSKVVEDEEHAWLISGLDILTNSISTYNEEIVTGLCNTWIEAIVKSASLKIYKSYKVLNAHAIKNVEGFTKPLINTLNNWLSTNTEEVKAQRLQSFIYSILDKDQDLKEELAKSLFITSHHPFVLGTNGPFVWLEAVRQTQLEVVELISKYQDDLLNNIFDLIRTTEHQSWRSAGYEAAKSLAVVHPSDMGTAIIKASEKFLNLPELPLLQNDQINIYFTPADKMYFDPLSSNSNKGTVTRHLTADEKWEQEVRESAAKKNAQNKPVKLSKDQQEKVTKQLAKEAEIRKEVSQISNSLTNGLQLVNSVISGWSFISFISDLSDDAKKALSHALSIIFDAVIIPQSSRLTGSLGLDLWLKLSVVVDGLPNIANQIGFAALRAHGVNLSQEMEGEPLNELANHVMFKLLSFSQRSSLNVVAFNYTFPLIRKILLDTGIGFEASKKNAVLLPNDLGHDDDQPSPQAEQMVLALDTLGAHSKVCEDASMPRLRMIEVLIHVISTQPTLISKAQKSIIELCDFMGQSELVYPEEIKTLLDSLYSESQFVRKASLQGLELIDLTQSSEWAQIFIESNDTSDKDADESKRESELAANIWEDNQLSLPENYLDTFIELICHSVAHTRDCVANSFVPAIQTHPDTINSVLQAIYDKYSELIAPPTPIYDEFGMLVRSKEPTKDKYEIRVSLAHALANIIPLASAEHIPEFLNFQIETQSLGDRNELVRKAMLQAAQSGAKAHGKEHLSIILPVYEEYLSRPDEKTDVQDWIRESTVILYGTLATNLTAGDAKISETIDRLIVTLDTPSETVQLAVAECLPPLVKAYPSKAQELLPVLLEKTTTAPKYAHRRGAAYGIAGVVKGKGLSSLKDFNVIGYLKEAITSKKVESKEGALFSFETLSEMLGRLFEPYVIQILPLLLTCFSDPSRDVQEATTNTARVIMSKLSGHGVKLTLPSLLSGLEVVQWRSKRGAIQLLGSMVYCAPKQLSVSLPVVVPRLVEVLNDTHIEVRNSAQQALYNFGSVISNPEIQSLIDVILDALIDPSAKTAVALKALLNTTFVHYIDPPSLALVVPILSRGLKERVSIVKKQASQIVGQMAFLTDQKDLLPYIPNLLPGLKDNLMDPVPDTRAIASKSLGQMVSKLGEDHFPELVSQLMSGLRCETSFVERSGAAQGLSEVLSGLDIKRFEGLLPEVLQNTFNPKPYVREGFITLLAYLPATFGLKYEPYLRKVLPVIVRGLADDSDYVRDCASRIIQIVITNYPDRTTDLILPVLAQNLYHESWRIRQSVIQLIGDLIFKLMGITMQLDENTGAEDDEDDDEDEPVSYSAKLQTQYHAIIDALGKPRWEQLYGGLQYSRQDESPLVRQAANQVCKAIMFNIPRSCIPKLNE
jgi:HEAT repeat protein